MYHFQSDIFPKGIWLICMATYAPHLGIFFNMHSIPGKKGGGGGVWWIAFILK